MMAERNIGSVLVKNGGEYIGIVHREGPHPKGPRQGAGCGYHPGHRNHEAVP